jgi:hypothetical protein
VKKRIGLFIVRIGLWIYDLEPCAEWSEEDWSNYRRLKDFEKEFLEASK